MYGKFYEYCVLYYIYGKNDILEIYDIKIYEQKNWKVFIVM